MSMKSHEMRKTLCGFLKNSHDLRVERSTYEFLKINTGLLKTQKLQVYFSFVLAYFSDVIRVRGMNFEIKFLDYCN